MMPLAVSCDANGIISGTIAFLFKAIKIRCYMTILSCDANDIVNGTITFLKSRWSKWTTSWLFGHVVHWHQKHMVPMALSTAPLHSLDKHDQHEVQHDLFGHVIPVAIALASHDVESIVHGTIGMRCNLTYLVIECHWCPAGNGTITGIIVSLTSAWLKWGATWPFLSCDAIGIFTNVHWWCHVWHHYNLYVKMIEMRCNMTFWSSDTNCIVSGTWN